MAAKSLFRGLIFFVMVCFASTFLKAVELMNNHEIQIAAKESIGNIAVNSMKSVEATPLDHEAMFTDTIKQCMPSAGTDSRNGMKKQECKTFVPEGSKERIAVLAPPGKLDTSLLKFIRIVLSKGRKGRDGKIAAAQVEVIPTTNMAPYGYGETHGYTRIIRVVPQPLILGATNTLSAALQSLSSSSTPLSLNDITLNDLKASLRQQIRYHCRLNHIAAHTAMWSIGVEDFADLERDLLVDIAQDFFGLDSRQEGLFGEVNAQYGLLGPDDDDDSKHGVIKEEDDDNAVAELNHIYAEGSRMMSLVRNKVINQMMTKTINATTDILKVLDDVLLDEMLLSKNLTAWPCESFWTVGEPGSRLELSPIIRRISRAMSPNCTAPYTSCFVKKDKCEAKGDGNCK